MIRLAGTAFDPVGQFSVWLEDDRGHMLRLDGPRARAVFRAVALPETERDAALADLWREGVTARRVTEGEW